MEIKKEDLEFYIKEHPYATQSQIAEFFKVSVTKIRKLIDEYKLPYTLKIGKRSNIRVEDIKKYLEDFPKATINDLAKEFNAKIPALKRLLKKYGLETRTENYNSSAVLRQQIFNYIKLNPKATKLQISIDLQISFEVLDLYLRNLGVEWNEEEKRFISKEDKQARINMMRKIEERNEKDEEYSDFSYRKVKKEEVEAYKKSHPKAGIRQIAAFFNTGEEEMRDFIKKHKIDLEKIEQEVYEIQEKQHESKERFVDKVIKLLNNNPTATPEDVQERINKKHGKNFDIRRFLEIRRVELIQEGKKKEAEKIKSFLVRGIDDKRATEEIIKGITKVEEDR